MEIIEVEQEVDYDPESFNILPNSTLSGKKLKKRLSYADQNTDEYR